MTTADSAQEPGEQLSKEPCKGLSPEVVREQYESVCNSYRSIDDFRAKLLALWPILGGAAGGVVLLTSNTTNMGHLWAVGLVGMFVSFGIAVHELTQTMRCGLLLELAERLEQCLELRLGTGQFSSIPHGFPLSLKTLTLKQLEQRPEAKDEAAHWKSRLFWAYPVRTGVASVIVYGSVLAGWIGIFIWGVYLALK
jgi:hypothetical protein